MDALVIGFLIALGMAAILAIILWVRQKAFTRYFEQTLAAFAEGNFHTRMYGQTGLGAKAIGAAVNRMADAIEEMVRNLSQERDVLQHILHRMSTGLVYVNGEGKVDMVNEAAAQLFKRPHEQWVGREHWTIFRLYMLSAEIDRALLTGVNWRGKLVLRDDLLLDVSVVAVKRDHGLLGAQDKRYDALVLFNDVSEWQRLERMRSDFIANVSHELRTPIAAIRGFAETLLDDDEVDARIRSDFLRTIFEESKRMGNLVADLLELSKLERQGQSIQLRACSLRSVADQAVARLSMIADERAIQIHVDIRADVTVWADEEKLLQVFLNLLQNAIHYTPPGGRVQIWSESYGECVRVHVVDNGIGIPRDHQSRVFERFYRVDPDRSRASGGTGLGLAIVKHIVAAHGGDVGVASEPSKGSDFWFTLTHLQYPDDES